MSGLSKKTLLVACAVAVAASFAVLAPLASAIVTPTFTISPGPITLNGVSNAGEPSIGADLATGAFLFEASATTYKIVISGGSATWTSAARPVTTPNLDPILATDPATGRTWAGGLDGSCSILSYTDDDGASWTPVANSCSGTIDHETIGAGPWHNGVGPAGATSSRAVYYCAQESRDACAVSLDGGLTFAPPLVVNGACGSLHGHVKVSSFGVAFLPNDHCGGPAGGAINVANGLAWNSYTISGSCAATTFDPSVGTTDSGWVYEAWQGCDNHMHVALSKDNATTWINATDLSTSISPSVLIGTMPAVVAGVDNRAAVAYLGSTTGGNGFTSSFAGTWDLYVSYTYDGGHSWTTVKVTSDPVQRGWICAGGITGCSGPGRNLLDFIDATADASGNVVVAFADGCINVCAGATGTSAQSTSAWATIAAQTGGTPLR